MGSLLKLPAQIDEGSNRRLRREYTSLLSTKLKEVRKSKRITQQELAEKAGLHLTYVGHLELGKYHPTVFVMWKIAKALGVPMSELTDL